MSEDKQDWKREMKMKLLERQSEAKVVRKIVLISLAVFIALVIVTATAGYFYISSSLKPVDKDSKEMVKVEIPIGSGVSTISNILEDNGIIKNAQIFKYYIKFNNEAGFQAGNYSLSPSMTLDEIIDIIKNGKVAPIYTIPVPEGRDLEEIADVIADKLGMKSKEVLKVMNDKKFIKSMMDTYPDLLTDEILAEDIRYPLEGYLYPATYSIYEEEPAIESVISLMIKKNNEVIAKYEEAMGEDWTPHELLTMASLIEEEATEQADRDKISAVFQNRMKIDMPLQTDPTVLYALGEHKDRVMYKDLKVESPYNLYIHKGLTPGPISNAGETSISAALNPADIKDLYFLATPSGEVLFNETLEEHNKDKAEHITNN